MIRWKLIKKKGDRVIKVDYVGMEVCNFNGPERKSRLFCRNEIFFKHV